MLGEPKSVADVSVSNRAGQAALLELSVERGRRQIKTGDEIGDTQCVCRDRAASRQSEGASALRGRRDLPPLLSDSVVKHHRRADPDVVAFAPRSSRAGPATVGGPFLADGWQLLQKHFTSTG